MKRKRHMLLTGATGLIGAYLLSRLYKCKGDMKITAIVRGKDDEHAKQRLVKMASYFGSEVDFSEIEVFSGDLTQENLGLAEEKVAYLKDSITDLFHSAAEISFDEDENSTISRTNFLGTRHVLELCGPETDVFYVSTAYVAGNTLTEFDEEMLNINQTFKNAYEKSKFEAESYVREFCKEKDLELTVLRPSIVVGEYATGKTFQFVAFYKVLKTVFVLCKNAPEGTELDLPCNPNGTLNFIPVDLLTDMIEEIVLSEDAWGKTYHLINSTPPTDGDMIRIIGKIAGIKVKVLDEDDAPENRLAKMFVRQMNRYLPYMQGQPEFGVKNRNQLKSAPLKIEFNTEFIQKLLGYCEMTNWGKEISHSR